MPTTQNAVLIIVVFLMPGFIASTVLSFVYPKTETGATQTVLTAITLSSFNYAILSWLLVLFWRQSWYENVELLAGVSVFFLFVSPVILALLFGMFNDSRWGRKVRQRFGVMHPIPKAWDYFFRRGEPCWVVATMKDGKVTAGLFGESSFASSYPADEDIYLEKVCRLSPDGKMEAVIPNSSGAIIRMENVTRLEFFESDQPSC